MYDYERNMTPTFLHYILRKGFSIVATLAPTGTVNKESYPLSFSGLRLKLSQIKDMSADLAIKNTKLCVFDRPSLLIIFE